MLACPKCGSVQSSINIIFPRKSKRLHCDSCGRELFIIYKPSRLFEWGTAFIYGFLTTKLMSQSDIKMWLLALGFAIILDSLGKVNYSTLSNHAE